MTLTLRHLLTRSLLHRRARSLSALVALTVSAAITTALLTLFSDLDSKLHREFRSFGANILVTTPGGQPLPPAALSTVRQIAGPDTRVVPFAYAVVITAQGTPVVLAGTDLRAARMLNSSWAVDDDKPASGTAPAADALVGAKAARALADPDTFLLSYNNHAAPFHTAGLLRTGGDEDSRIYTSLETFTALTGSGPTVLELQVPGSRSRVESALSALGRALPGLTIAPVRQLVEGESRIVDRTHALMLGAVILVALTVAVSVLATLSAAVLERRRDFALMKALGGSQRRLTSLFLLETLTLALAGVLAGFLLGSAAAWIIGEINFQTSTHPHLQVLPAVLLLNLLVAAVAAFLPTRSLRLLQPAALLKGE